MSSIYRLNKVGNLKNVILVVRFIEDRLILYIFICKHTPFIDCLLLYLFIILYDIFSYLKYLVTSKILLQLCIAFIII